MSKSVHLRADAARNRDRLLGAAREKFSSQHGDVTLEEIAQQAGVGIGTLYRHFPSREALVEAVYRSELDALLADGEKMLRGRTAFEALRLWMDRYTKFVATKQAMHETLRKAFTTTSGPPIETRAKVRAVIGRFLAAGQSDRTIRSDVKEDDLAVSLAATVLATNLVTDRAQARRVLDLLSDALRPRK